MDQAVQPAPAGRRIHYERRRPEETTLYQLVQEHLETFLAQVELETGAGLPDFVKEEFDAFLECGILVHGFLRLRCADCADEKLVAFSCKKRGFCPACGARRMAEKARHRDVACLARRGCIIHRTISGFLIQQAGLKRTEADTGAVTLIQRFGSAANLNIPLHCLVLDGVYRTTEGVPVFHEVPAPTVAELQSLLSRIINAPHEVIDPRRLSHRGKEPGLEDKQAHAGTPVIQGVARVLMPNRAQIELRASDLESLLPEGHRARIVWAYVEQADLSRMYAGSGR